MDSTQLEWYRIVHPDPSSDLVDRRTKAIQQIADAINDSTNLEFSLDCTSGFVAGFSSIFNSSSPVVSRLVEIIRASDSAFSGNLLEVDAELQVCVGLALLQVITNPVDIASEDRHKLILTLLASAVEHRHSTKEDRVRRMMVSLADDAKKTLFSSADKARAITQTRRELVRELDSLEASIEEGDEAVSPEAFRSLLSITRGLLSQDEIDREELEVLWWTFSGRSYLLRCQLSDLASPADLGASVGLDLAETCILPPPRNIEGLIRNALKHGSPSIADRVTPLKDLIAGLDIKLQNEIVNHAGARRLAKEHPALLPLTWVCDRLVESEGSATWEGEFLKKTGLKAGLKLSLDEYARQVFYERIVARLYSQVLGG